MSTDSSFSPPRTLRFNDLASYLQGTILQCKEDLPVGTILIDTRKLSITPHCVFIAMHGLHHDSHQYLPSAYLQGVRQFMVEKEHFTSEILAQLPEANILAIEKALPALQALATHHRRMYTIPVLAITGSNGKTIIKEWLSQLLAQQYHVVQSPKSYNSQIGVPLSILMMQPEHSYGVFEAGISLPGEMERLNTIIQPTSGIFANIGTAHGEGFASQVQKAEEKALLFKGCEEIFYCKDHTVIDAVLREKYEGNTSLISWSLSNPAATYQVILEPEQHKQMKVIVNEPEVRLRYTFTLPFQHKVYVENAIHCIVFLLKNGFLPATIQLALHHLKTTPMRLSLKQGIHGCQLIDDTYNNDLTGLAAALDFMWQQNQSLEKTVIISDFLQTGIDPQIFYQQVAQLLINKKVSHLIGVGTTIATYAYLFEEMDARFYPSTIDCLKSGRLQQLNNELILIKGAREFALERIVDRLQQKIHSTVLEIDLDAVTHNLNYFRRKLSKSTKLMVMTKASAYGSGTFEIPHLLQHNQIDYLGVAYTDEGVLLRENGVHLPIMVMNPAEESFDNLIQYQLEPEIYSLRLLKALGAFLQAQSASIKIHLKVNTGFNRLGLDRADLEKAIAWIQEHPSVHVTSVFSHLAASEDIQEDSFTHLQAQKLIQQATFLEQKLGTPLIKHLLNSSGILRFAKDYQMDMVRLGIGLYGIGVNPEEQKHLQVVSTLKTVISQIRTLQKGETIGYNRKGVVDHEMKVATIAIGYADGFLRGLGNGKGIVWIHGQPAPVIGNVCMDMTMINITGIEAKEGDAVIIFGKKHPISDIANALNTSPYEVLTNVSERVKRVYFTY